MATHDITLTGDVQNVGLRTQIVGLGHGKGRRVIVYNESDDTVQVLANGEDVEGFIDGIRAAVENTRAEVHAIERRTLDVDVNLPRFSCVRTDDLGDVTDRLDAGIDILDDVLRANEAIRRDTERLESIEAATEQLGSIKGGHRAAGVDTEQLESIKVDTERLGSIERHTGELVKQQSEFLDALADDS